MNTSKLQSVSKLGEKIKTYLKLELKEKDNG